MANRPREQKKKYKIGDLAPLKTAMQNVVWCEVRENDWNNKHEDHLRHPDYMYDEKALIFVLDEMRYRKKNGMDCISMNTGRERSGKSHYTFIKKKVFESPLYQNDDRLKDILATDNWNLETFTRCTKLNLEDIAFSLDDYTTALNKAIEGDGRIKINDESGVGLSSLKWWEKSQVDLYIQFQVIGKKKIVTDLNLPHMADLNNRMRNRRVAFLSHVFTERDESTVLKRGFIEHWQADENMWELNTWWEPWLMHCFPDHSADPDWITYEAKKDAFIQHIQETMAEDDETKKLTGRSMRYFRNSMKLAMEMLHPSNGHKDNSRYTQEELAKLLEIGQPSLSRALNKFKAQEAQRLAEQAKLMESMRDDNRTAAIED